jgi:hypothetical protein
MTQSGPQARHVCSPDGVLPIATFKPAYREVRPCYLLEVVDERVVHRRAAERTDDRDGLRGELLRDYHAEAGSGRPDAIPRLPPKRDAARFFSGNCAFCALDCEEAKAKSTSNPVNEASRASRTNRYREPF